MTRDDLNYAISTAVKEVLAAFDIIPGKTSTTSKDDTADTADDDRFITREETSKLLHVDFSTLWRWNRDGLLTSVKAGPRRVMYRHADVMRMLGGNMKGKHILSERKED